MTEKANPSINRPIEAFKTSGAIALAGGSTDGWISDAETPSDISTQDTSIDETSLNAFTQTSNSSSLSVSIEGGEAFVYGAWIAIDTSTSVTLSASTAGQTVYVGWNKDGTNDVIIGLSSAFSSATGNTDEKIPLWEFDTDSTGVTNVTDYRSIGKHITAAQLSTYTSVETDETLRVLSDTAMVTGGPYTVDGELVVDGSFTDTIGSLRGSGVVRGNGIVRAAGINATLEPIDATIDGTTFVAISGWTTDNDSETYGAYRFARGGSIEIEQGEALTLTV